MVGMSGSASGRFRGLCCRALTARPSLGGLDGLAAWHVGIPFFAETASGAVTTEAPPWRHRQRGRIPGGDNNPAKIRTVALCLPANASPFCDNLLAKFAPRRSWNDRPMQFGADERHTVKTRRHRALPLPPSTVTFNPNASPQRLLAAPQAASGCSRSKRAMHLCEDFTNSPWTGLPTPPPFQPYARAAAFAAADATTLLKQR